MFAVRLPSDADQAAFRAVARRAIALEQPPRQIAFVSPDQPSLFEPLPENDAEAAFSVPRGYAELMHDAVCHRAADRFALLYDVLWRIVHGERDLVANAADPSVARLNDYARAVRRDIHKMHAFVRFRPREIDGETVHVAWFEPQHFILRRAAAFFVNRFAGMHWLIATPIGTAAWRDGALEFGPPPAAKPTEIADPVLDELWLAYFRTTFNPARLRTKAMVTEMPRHYWRNMPETRAIPDMIAGAADRVAHLHAAEPDQAPLFAQRIAARGAPPPELRPDADALPPLEALRHDIAGCRNCPLQGPATQAVCGEGPATATLMFVGEQPGDQEDLAGRPFVGPAGQVFDRALREAGHDRDSVYVTNAVKHFKFAPRGKKRIHQKPNTGEVKACRWWLDREIEIVRPRLVVALGGTAASALAGRPVSVLRERGAASFGPQRGFVTVHPSFLLRLPDERAKAAEYEKFVADLRQVRALLAA